MKIKIKPKKYKQVLRHGIIELNGVSFVISKRLVYLLKELRDDYSPLYALRSEKTYNLAKKLVKAGIACQEDGAIHGNYVLKRNYSKIMKAMYKQEKI